MRQGFATSAQIGTTIRIDPRIVLGSQLLQLTQAQLYQAIEAELAENPALERIEDALEPVTPDEILRAVAPAELKLSSEDREYRRSMPNDDSPVDWTELAPASTDLRDHLSAQLLPQLPSNLHKLGEYVIACLEDSGYLLEPVEDIALSSNSTIDEVEQVVSLLQNCEPAGIGSQCLRECLLAQLRETKTVEEKLARNILRYEFEELVSGRTMKIARRFKVIPELVEEAFDLIRELNPYPGEGFTTYHAPLHRTCAVEPDLCISRSDNGWSAEVLGEDVGLLKVSNAYVSRQKALGQAIHPDKDEKRHVGHFVQRAKQFISALEQRRQTLKKVGEYLVASQASFLSTGKYEFLQSLTRTQMAQDLGLHESTISRATNGKFVKIANGEVVSFDVFFKPALRVQKMIEEILSFENPHDPLTDERIMQMLAERGVVVARRTVNKYRDRTRLLSSRKRKTA